MDSGINKETQFVLHALLDTFVQLELKLLVLLECTVLQEMLL